jgi:hypothetical protein
MLDRRALLGVQGRIGVASCRIAGCGVKHAGFGGIGHNAAGQEMSELYIYPVSLRKHYARFALSRYPQNLCITMWKSAPLTWRKRELMRLSTTCPLRVQVVNYLRDSACAAPALPGLEWSRHPQ